MAWFYFWGNTVLSLKKGFAEQIYSLFEVIERMSKLLKTMAFKHP